MHIVCRVGIDNDVDWRRAADPAYHLEVARKLERGGLHVPDWLVEEQLLAVVGRVLRMGATGDDDGVSNAALHDELTRLLNRLRFDHALGRLTVQDAAWPARTATAYKTGAGDTTRGRSH
jgi:hypothetical protein